MNKLKFIGILLVSALVLFSGCDALQNSLKAGQVASNANILKFEFAAYGAVGTFADPIGNAILVKVPTGVNLAAMVPSVILSDGASAKVGSTVVDGTNAIDFSGTTTTVTVTSANGATKDYVVTIEFLPALTINVTGVTGTFTGANASVTLVGQHLYSGNWTNDSAAMTKTAFDSGTTLSFTFGSNLVAESWFPAGANFVFKLVQTGTWTTAWGTVDRNNGVTFSDTVTSIDFPFADLN